MSTNSAQVTFGLSVAAFLSTIYIHFWTRRQHSFQARQSYNSAFRSWSGKCITALSSAVHSCKDSDEHITRPILIELSALADQGRLYFINQPLRAEPTDDQGFSGFRPQILDWLVYSHKLLGRDHSAEQALERRVLLRSMQVGFTQDAQTILDPNNLESNMGQLRSILVSTKVLNREQSNGRIREIKRVLGGYNDD